MDRQQAQPKMNNDNQTLCLCDEDAEGNLIPNAECELHWHQVIDGGDTPPAWAFP